MANIRARLNMDEELSSALRPTRFPTDRNNREVTCDSCGVKDYVDEATFKKIEAVLSRDPGDNPYLCEDCIETLEDPDYR